MNCISSSAMFSSKMERRVYRDNDPAFKSGFGLRCCATEKSTSPQFPTLDCTPYGRNALCQKNWWPRSSSAHKKCFVDLPITEGQKYGKNGKLIAAKTIRRFVCRSGRAHSRVYNPVPLVAYRRFFLKQ